MAGLSDYMAYGADTDDLIRSAQTGNLQAYKELIRRGENIPPPAIPQGRFGQHGRPGGAPVPVLGLEEPSYLRPGPFTGGPSRDMSRPASTSSGEPPPLPFMSAINQGPPPDVASTMDLSQGPAPDDPISRIANGQDAAAPIQAGAARADAETGATEDSAHVLPGPIGAMAQALTPDESDPNGYSGYIADIINNLKNGANPARNKSMALAQAGFAMAASGSPTFFGAVGQGGLAGLKDYQESQDRDMENQVRAAGLAGHELGREEDIRSHKTQEGLEQQRTTETQRSNIAQEGHQADELKERQRSDRANEAIARGALGISGTNATIALGHLKLAQDTYAEEQRRYDAGEGDARALRAAQIKLTQAQADAQASLDVDRGKDIVYTEGGGAVLVDKKTNQSVPIVDSTTGDPIKAVPKAAGLTAAMKNAKYYADIGLFDSEKDAAAAGMRGKLMTPDRRQVEAYKLADGQLANHPELIGQAADDQRETWAQSYYELLGGDATTAPGAPTPSAAAPAASPYNSPDDVKRDYQSGKITKQQATDYIRKLQGQ